ncbi:MAG: hypothetical protein NVSMB59_22690 [Vulcanimicrobiaceae bacterium]
MSQPTRDTQRTDFDVLSAIFAAGQRLAAAENEYEIAKENRKTAKDQLEREIIFVNSHVATRRDELSMPKMPGQTTFSLDGTTGGPTTETVGADLPVTSLRDEAQETVAFVRCENCNHSYLRNAKPDACECGRALP